MRPTAQESQFEGPHWLLPGLLEHRSACNDHPSRSDQHSQQRSPWRAGPSSNSAKSRQGFHTTQSETINTRHSKLCCPTAQLKASPHASAARPGLAGLRTVALGCCWTVHLNRLLALHARLRRQILRSDVASSECKGGQSPNRLASTREFESI